MIRIEPYSDKEVKSVLTNLMNNQEFIKFIKSNLNKSTSKFLSIPGSSLMVMQLFKSKVKNINSVKEFQDQVKLVLKSVVDQTIEEFQREGISPEILFWVGCAGSFDDRAKRITKAFVKILNSANISFGVLGKDESCTGDPAKRAGNEFLFQMQAMTNIEVLNSFEIKTIVTTCPHCFNTLKNEYPDLGGNYKVYHHTQFINKLLEEGRFSIDGGSYNGKKITYHDPCFLGRANNEYNAPRNLIKKIDAELAELKRCKSKALCCGAGGAQMFKESEKGSKEINIKRTEEALETKSEIIAAGCPFCNTMLTDGIKSYENENDIEIKDISTDEGDLEDVFVQLTKH